MKNESKFVSVLAAMGLVLVAPVALDFLSYFSSLAVFAQTILVFGSGDPKGVAGFISGMLVTQVQSILVIIPGLLICSFVVLKYRYQEKWFGVTLKVLSVLMLLMLPFYSLVSLYAFYLSSKNQSNA